MLLIKEDINYFVACAALFYIFVGSSCSMYFLLM